MQHFDQDSGQKFRKGPEKSHFCCKGPNIAFVVNFSGKLPNPNPAKLQRVQITYNQLSWNPCASKPTTVWQHFNDLFTTSFCCRVVFDKMNLLPHLLLASLAILPVVLSLKAGDCEVCISVLDRYDTTSKTLHTLNPSLCLDKSANNQLFY